MVKTKERKVVPPMTGVKFTDKKAANIQDEPHVAPVLRPGNLDKHGQVRAPGFKVRAVQTGIYADQRRKEGSVFVIQFADQFSDADVEIVREQTDKDGHRTGVKKKSGLRGWMERVAPAEAEINVETVPGADGRVGGSTGDRDVLSGDD